MEEAKRREAINDPSTLWMEKLMLRQKNLSIDEPSRPDESALRRLDNSLKAKQSFVKKLRTICEENSEILIQELSQINLSLYVSETVPAILDAKIKVADVPAVIRLCSALHQSYGEFAADFSSAVHRALKAALSEQPTLSSVPGSASSDETSKLNRKKVLLRLSCELFVTGLTRDHQNLLAFVRDIAQTEPITDPTFPALSLATTFVRYYGDILAGILPRGKESQDYAAIGQQVAEMIPSVERRKFRDLFCTSLYNRASEIVSADYTEIRSMEFEQRKMLATKGEVPGDFKATYERLRRQSERLNAAFAAYCELIGAEVPPPPAEDENITRLSLADSASALVPGSAEPMPEDDDNPFDDEETQNFYEKLPNLREVLPGALLEHGGSSESQSSEGASGHGSGGGGGGGGGKKHKDSESSASPSVSKARQEERDASMASSMAVDEILSRLPRSCSRSLIDQLAVDLCYANVKSQRRRVIGALFSVPRTSLELLPHYARLVAILSIPFRDFGASLVHLLDEEFDDLFKNKNQINIESKIKNIRFIGELVKFRIYPAPSALLKLSRCLEDFNHHNIDVACNLLEICGRFLYKNKESHIRTNNLLQTLMRLKNARNLETRQENLILNAFYMSKPPEKNVRLQHKQRTPLQQYIRHLILECHVHQRDVQHVARQLRKCFAPGSCSTPFASRSAVPQESGQDASSSSSPSSLADAAAPAVAADASSASKLKPADTNNAVRSEIISCLRKAHRVRYSNVQSLASICATLSRHYSEIGIAVADHVLQDIRLAVEVSNANASTYTSSLSIPATATLTVSGPFLAPQRRNVDIRYLGELYNFHLVESKVIFHVLFVLLFAFPQNDAPEDFFRLRLACTLLDTCVPCFDKPSTVSKLRHFLPFLYFYVHFKQQWFSHHIASRGSASASYDASLPRPIPLLPLPVDVDYFMADTLEIIDACFRRMAPRTPPPVWPKTYKEALSKLSKSTLPAELAHEKKLNINLSSLTNAGSAPKADLQAEHSIVEKSALMEHITFVSQALFPIENKAFPITSPVSLSSSSSASPKSADAVIASPISADGELDESSFEDDIDVISIHSDDDENDDGSRGSQDGENDMDDDEDELRAQNDDNDGIIVDEYSRLSAAQFLSVRTAEEEEFDREFQLMMQESAAEARRPSAAANRAAASVLPSSLPSALLRHPTPSYDDQSDAPESGENSVRFTLLTRKNGKQKAQDLFVPTSVSLASQEERRKQEEQEERQNVKNFILKSTEREEEANWPLLGRHFPRGRPGRFR